MRHKPFDMTLSRNHKFVRRDVYKIPVFAANIVKCLNQSLFLQNTNQNKRFDPLDLGSIIANILNKRLLSQNSLNLASKVCRSTYSSICILYRSV